MKVEFKDIETEAIEPEDLELRSIDLDRSWDRSVSNPRKNCEKISYWQTCLTSSHRCIPNTTQRRALQTRTLKMESYENAGFTAVFAESRRL